MNILSAIASENQADAHLEESARHRARKAAYNHCYYAAHREVEIERARLYCEAHRDAVLAQRREYRSTHKELIAAQAKAYRASASGMAQERQHHKEYYQAHKKRCSDKNRAYYEGHKELLLPRIRAYAQLHKEEARNYRESHREEAAACARVRYASEEGRIRRLSVAHRRRARKRNAMGADYTTAEMIAARCEMWGNRCYICGAPMQAIDHVKPLVKGGAHLPCNLRPICTSCNAKKGDRWPL